MEETTTLPTEAQISQTIAYIKRRFNHPNMNKPVNRSVKEGYTEALRILAEGITDPRQIEGPTTVQGLAIADMAIDYLKGDRTQHVLINVPLKS